MAKKGAPAAVAFWLTLALVLNYTGCQKLDVNYIKGNFHFSRANALFTDGRYRNAIEEYEKAREFYEKTKINIPNLVHVYRFLGESYKSLFRPGAEDAENLERANKAVDFLTKAYEMNPSSKEIIYSLGDMYDKLKRFEDAEKLYLRILELEPGNMNNYYVVAEFYKRYASEKQELRAKAESMYFRRIEADPENPQGYAYLANYYENIQPIPEFDKANDCWEKRIVLDPDNAEAYLAKGVNRWSKAYRLANLPAAERLRYAQDSLKALERATQLAPDYPEPYSWLSVLYKSVLAKLEPEKESRYNAEADRFIEKFQDLRKRQAERKKLEEELKKIK